MLQHLPFYDVLATADESLPVWAPTVAGLAVLSLVDAARSDQSIVDADWTGMKAVTDTVSALREGSPLRRPMLTVLERLRDGGPDWRTVDQALFAYGRALDLEGHWSLAADVFATVADLAREHRDAALAIEATTALGGAARRSGDWEKSANSYAAAAHLADAVGDKASGLTVQVGTANTHIARGNLPAARMILDDVIAEAGKSALDGVQALAYHARATVAHQLGDYAETVDLAYKALEKTTNPTAQDAIHADIAAAFMELGLHDAARDTYLVVSTTSRQQWVRWQATINLMELAAIDRVESAFDSYAKQLKNAALDPRLRSYFLLYHGKGALAFGREAEGLASIREAQEFAAENKIHQVAHEAAQLLAGTAVQAPAAAVASELPSCVREVAEAMSQRRDLAFSASQENGWH